MAAPERVIAMPYTSSGTSRTIVASSLALADVARGQVEGSDGAVGAENGCERLGSVVADGGARERERRNRAVPPAQRERELGGDERPHRRRRGSR